MGVKVKVGVGRVGVIVLVDVGVITAVAVLFGDKGVFVGLEVNNMA